MTIKLNFSRILFVLSIIALNEPIIFYYNRVHMLFSAGKMIALLYAFYLFIKHFRMMNATIAVIIAYYLLLFFPTLSAGGDIRVWFRIFYMFVSTIVIVHVHMHKEPRFVISTLFNLITAILFINLIYLAMLGPDMVAGNYGGAGIRYFIGIRTRIGEWVYVGLLVGMIHLYYEDKKYDFRFIVLMASILIFITVNRVTTAIFMLAVFGIMKLMMDRDLIKLNGFLVKILYGVLALNVLVIVFNIQESFGWFFDFLGEDTTLNSRTIIWASVLEKIKATPLLGHGVGHIAQFELRKLFYGSRYTAAAHNQFLSILYESGIIGFGLYLTFTGRILSKFQGREVTKLHNTITAMVIIFLVSMTVEISGDNVLYFTMMMIVANYDKIIDDCGEEEASYEKGLKNRIIDYS